MLKDNYFSPCIVGQNISIGGGEGGGRSNGSNPIKAIFNTSSRAKVQLTPFMKSQICPVSKASFTRPYY